MVYELAAIMGYLSEEGAFLVALRQKREEELGSGMNKVAHTCAIGVETVQLAGNYIVLSSCGYAAMYMGI